MSVFATDEDPDHDGYTIATRPQNEVTIAVNPRNTDRLFVFANHNNDDPKRLFAAHSLDRGASWQSSNGSFVLLSVPGSSLDPTRDPSAAWDGFGNLYIAFRADDTLTGRVVVAKSIDGGGTFSHLHTFEAPVGAAFIDQPTIVAGPGQLDPQTGIRGEALWLTYHVVEFPPPFFELSYGFPKVHSAEIRGFNDVGPFDQSHTFDLKGAFADLTVGPVGQILVAYSIGSDPSADERSIAICHDSDGRGPSSFSSCFSTSFHSGSSSLSPEISIAYDRSSATNARAYLVYTYTESAAPNDTNILLRTCDTAAYSTCGAGSWSSEMLVNDDATTARQSLPWMDVDPASVPFLKFGVHIEPPYIPLLQGGSRGSRTT